MPVIERQDTADTGRKRRLGRTDLRVFPVGLGAMALSMPRPMRGSAPGSEQPSDPPAAVIRAAIDAGIDFIDTANVYCPGNAIGANERLIRDTLRTLGVGGISIATKGGVDRMRQMVNGTPAFLRAACIASLRDLGCDAITLYQLHSPDDTVPLEESIGELARLQAEGKIVHLGLCNATLDELGRAQATARIETLQNACNPLNAGDYADGLLAACEAQGVSYIPHTVVGGTPRQATIAAMPVIATLARRYAVPAHAIVVAWHLAKGPGILPIPGATRVASIVSSAAAAELVLTCDEVRAIDGLAAAAAS